MSTATLNQNLTSGRWAVAIVGYREWRRESAIGDGITSALSALVTRCDSREEAEALAASLNAEQPAILPGTPAVPEYAAVQFDRSRFIGRQAREQNGIRSCDMRVVDLS